MKENLTEIVFILDESGSMYNLVNDTIGGFNSFIDAQKEEVGEANVTTVAFSTTHRYIHEGVNLKDLIALNSKDYRPNGGTALLDTIGSTILDLGRKLDELGEGYKPSKVIFVITTDGEENASREFTRAKIKEMIELQTNTYNWQFLFLGANIDAVSTAESFGILRSFACNYTASSVGTESVYSGLSKTVSSYREGEAVLDGWSDEIK